MSRLFLFIATLLATNVALAASYSVTQITDNNYYDEYAKINAKGDVVWTAWVNATDPGWTVFLYNADSKTSSAISANNVFFDSHQINANGDVIWTADDGNDHEVHLYSAATQTVRQLTSNDNHDTNPRISDGGNATWFEQTAIDGAVLMNYDAAAMSVNPVVYPGATRQGMQSMNADGDIVWNAEVGGEQDILLYTAADGAIRNISNSASVIASNQRLMDNGDIVWEAYDLLSSVRSILRFTAADGGTTSIASGISGFIVGSEGDIVWTSYLSGVYSINTFDPETETSMEIATQTGTRGPNIAGISARGDVAWSTIIGTDWISRVYNAETGATTDLTVTQGFGAYELHIADNGDVAWSLWDGTDYEVSTYQTSIGVRSQLSANQLDDGIIVMNANGALVWNRFEPTDSELVLAVKSTSDLTLDVSKVKLKKHDSEIKLLAQFTGATIPSPNETIAIHVDGVTLFSAPLADFRNRRAGVYTYHSKDVKVKIDFNRGMLRVSSTDFDFKDLNLSDGLDVQVDFGSASATDHYAIKRRK